MWVGHLQCGNTFFWNLGPWLLQRTSERPAMTAIFEMPMESETLSPEELTRITGSPRSKGQIDWLEANGWQFHRTRAQEAIVGRLYARLKLAGINPAAMTTSGGWVPDFSATR